MKKGIQKTLAIILAVLMVGSMLAACGASQAGSTKTPTATPTPSATASAAAEPTATPSPDVKPGDPTPRNETLYYSGLQWGPLNDFNPLSANSNNYYVFQQDIPTVLVYETLFMYNMLDGKLYPLLAKSYEQKDRVFTIKMNPDAKWDDGKPVTAQDVKYTFEIHRDMKTSQASMWDYIESIEAPDDQTVVITAKADKYNPLKILETLPKIYILAKHYVEKVVERNGGAADKVKTDKMEDYVSSGPYKTFFYDETKNVLKRNDNYWGKAPSMWGKLPAPKYITHNLFSDNNAGAVALQQGEVDVSQQFMPEIWKMWEDKNLPISTYIDEPPYYLSASIPSVMFNMNRPVTGNAAIRKAIALAIDYDSIATTAMSGYTPLMKDVPPSLMNPSAVEQGLIDKDALKPLQWTGKQIDEAKAVLDAAGIKDTDGDGYREFDGKKITLKVQCPKGWTDWNAALEMLAAAGQAIGLDTVTYFTDVPVWVEDMQTGNFDILMSSYAGASISNPWTRVYQTMYGSGGTTRKADRVYFNYSRYYNPEADKIIDQIPLTTDQAKLKEMYTALNKMYLTDLPTIPLMYRPALFHTVNESVWTGYPEQGDGSNIPPNVCCMGYGVAALYNLKNVK